MAVEFGPGKEKDTDFNLGMSQLEGTKIAVAPVEHEECRRDGSVTPFPTMGKFESTLQDTTLDIGREWSEISEWPEWEEDGTLNKDNVSSFLSEHDFLLLLPSSVSQMIQPNGNDIEHTMETLKHHSRNDSFGHDDANISLDMIFPEQVENNSSLQYKTPQFGLSGNLAGIENIQEEAPTALALDMKPKPSKCGKQKDSEMLPQIKISDTFAEHPSSTDRDDNDQPAPPSVLPSLPTRPTTPGG